MFLTRGTKRSLRSQDLRGRFDVAERENLVTKIFQSKTQVRFEHENENLKLDTYRER